ncbi:hypothetical protein [Bradyrhizobium sp. Ai1a-2]|uniref:hypothetical protein n=1 Tax=Bradyrhizobium sp. Ai1a-2 TaxID=196490 RepID=UPI00040BD32F|nr:hypothetical protein [Bradyrhizobium sp. Ai1a-2]
MSAHRSDRLLRTVPHREAVGNFCDMTEANVIVTIQTKISRTAPARAVGITPGPPCLSRPTTGAVALVV